VKKDVPNSMTTPSQALSAEEIILEGVTKQFPNLSKLAVDQVSFKVEAGNLVVLLGPSGCGKTTLLKMINRLYEPDAGRILIGGQEIHALPATELRRRIGYVIQQVGLFPHMTIRKNISVVPRLLRWDADKIDEKARQCLEMVRLPLEYLDRYPRQLSGGEQQRIGLARAMAADPPILLMDEPFAAVDAINRQHLQDELLEIQNKIKKTILFVTHDVEEAFRLADKIAIMQTGKLVQFGTPLDIVTRPENEFVEDLVGTRNILRRLSLLTVQSILDARGRRNLPSQPAKTTQATLPVLHPEDDLRSALSRFLESLQDEIQVEDQSGHKIDTITFADIRSSIIERISSQKENVKDELPDQ
jgi:osmoprotectant transport system ATP-binding protein